jgi:Acyl-CoA dehydrogenase, N-terminal domain
MREPEVTGGRKASALAGGLLQGGGAVLQKMPMGTGIIHTEHQPPLHDNCCSTMSTIQSLRLIATRPATRIIFRPQVSLSTFQHRSASSKHPKGFEAPTSEDLAELRERVQEFTRREITEEVAAKTDKSNSFPNEMWQRLGDAGFLGITADEDVGGLGMGYQAHCVVMEEISRYLNYIQTILAVYTH